MKIKFTISGSFYLDEVDLMCGREDQKNLDEVIEEYKESYMEDATMVLESCENYTVKAEKIP